MRATKFITVCALFTALIIAAQLALSFIAGVELVTVLLLSFAFYKGIKSGVTVAVCFSLLRCFIFGFYPTVIVLYLVYYSAFALFFGWLGKAWKGELSPVKLIITALLATAFTACFSLLDDVITPLFFGFDAKSTLAYFYSSLPFMLTQSICAALTVGALTVPLIKLYAAAKL